MADKYILQVTAGTSYNPEEHQVVPVNSSRPLSIESEHISVNLNVRIKAYRGLPLSSPITSSYFSLPRHAKDDDKYSISFAFSLKSTINGGDLLFGNDFENPIRDRLPPGFNTAFRIVKWFIDPGLEGDIYADKPYLYGPLGSSINILYVGSKKHRFLSKNNDNSDAELLFTEGGCEVGSALRKSMKIPDAEAARKKHFLDRGNLSNWKWEAGIEYGCDFFNPYLDFSAFTLRLPGFSLPIMKYWDGQALRYSKGKKSYDINPKRSHTLRYTLKNRATNTVLLVVVFTLYLEDDIDEHGVLKEGLVCQMD